MTRAGEFPSSSAPWTDDRTPLPASRWPSVDPERPVTREEIEAACAKFKAFVTAAEAHPDVALFRQGKLAEVWTPERVRASPPVMGLFEEGWLVAGLRDIYRYAIVRQRRLAKRLGLCVAVVPVRPEFPVGEARVVYGYWPGTPRQERWQRRKEDRDRVRRERRTGQTEFRFGRRL